VANVTDGPSGAGAPDSDVVSLPRPRPTRDSGKGKDGRGGGDGKGPGTRGPSRNRLTGRAGILALTLCAVMVTVAYPLRQYLAQRSQISGIEHQNSVIQQQVSALQSELAKWSDPAYVAIQARERLHYVRPGETGYLVPNPSPSNEPLGMPTPVQKNWYDRLWSTVKSPAPSPSQSPSPTP
jgi:cell division protein FtsB